MRKLLSLALVLSLATIIATPAFAIAQTGNGAPNGSSILKTYD